MCTTRATFYPHAHCQYALNNNAKIMNIVYLLWRIIWIWRRFYDCNGGCRIMLHYIWNLDNDPLAFVMQLGMFNSLFRPKLKKMKHLGSTICPILLYNLRIAQ